MFVIAILCNKKRGYVLSSSHNFLAAINCCELVCCRNSNRSLTSIKVPAELSFSISVDNAPGPPTSGGCPEAKLVGALDTIEEALAIVKREIGAETTDISRVPPLAFSRLARGGKTTLLALLYARLKAAGLRPLYVTLNGSSNFEVKENETQTEALLRVIGSQFIDTEKVPPHREVQCSVTDLDAWLGSCVLLIDELNLLGGAKPLEKGAGRLLRDMFLDRPGRYLVFTTHWPVAVDDSFSELAASFGSTPSPRGCLTLPMPVCSDLALLQNMPGCSALTGARAAIYGGIPSLIYSVISQRELSPSARFLRWAKGNELPRDKRPPVLEAFLSAYITGKASDELTCFDRFSSQLPDDKVQYPLCYAVEILQFLLVGDPTSADVVASFTKELEVYASRTDTGMDWEVVVTFALLVRCLRQRSLGSGIGDYIGLPRGAKPDVEFAPLPASTETLEDAHTFIARRVQMSSKPLLLLTSAVKAVFPVVDVLLVYSPGRGKPWSATGLQIKTGNRYPDADFPSSQWLQRGLHVRGAAPVKSNPTKRVGWEYLNESEIAALLGFSLCQMYPKNWLPTA
jgi:hypothetical protein